MTGRPCRALLLGLGFLLALGAPACASKKRVVPTEVPTLDSRTCLNLSLAQSELAAPSSPEALESARQTLKSSAPEAVDPYIDVLADAKGDTTVLAGDDQVAASNLVRDWLNIAC